MAVIKTVKWRQFPGSLASGGRATSSGRLSRATIWASSSSAGRICTLDRSSSDSVTP
jgi:hypothetical protein